MSRARRINLWISVVLILSACAHQRKYIGETSAPLQIGSVDCVKFATAGDWPAIKEHLDFCRNYKNSEGITPLMISAYKNQFQIFENLLAAGSDVHQKDKSGSDALFYAVNFHRIKMIKMLREHGAQITMNDFKVNALWVGLQKSSFDLIKVLNPTVEEINLQGDDGWSAIYFAIRRQEKEIFDFILKTGVQVNIVDSEGVSPFVFAKDEVKWPYAVTKLEQVTEAAFKRKN